MTPAMLLLVASLLAFAGGLLAADERGVWRAAAAWAVVLAALTGWWVSAPRGEVGGAVVAEARTDDGASIATTVVIQRPGATKRQVRRLPLARAVPGSAVALWVMLALGVVGAVWRHRRAAWLPAAGAVAAVVVLNLSGGGGGESGVRAFLETLEPRHLQSSTVPDAPWVFVNDARTPALVGAVLALLVLLPWRVPAGERLVGLGAALAAAAPVWQMSLAGGLPAAAVEGVVWAGGLMLAGAWFLRDAGWRTASLATASAVLAAGVIGG